MAGRKSKFNDTVIDIIITSHSNGLPMKYCADLAGISRSSLYNYINEGKNAKRGKKRDFYLKFVKARSQFILFHLKKINTADDWRASQYILSVIDKMFSPNFNGDISMEAFHEVKAEVSEDNDIEDYVTEYINRKLEERGSLISEDCENE